MWWAIKRGNESLLDLFHEKPGRETWSVDNQFTSLGRVKLTRRIIHINGDRSIRRWHQKPTIEHCAFISQPSIAIVPINNFDFLSPRLRLRYMSLHSQAITRIFLKTMHMQWFPRLSEFMKIQNYSSVHWADECTIQSVECGWHQYQNNHLFIWQRIGSGQARNFLTPISHLPILHS